MWTDSLLAEFVGFDILALGNVTVGSSCVEFPATVGTLDVIRRIGRRRRGQICWIPTCGYMLGVNLGCTNSIDEFLMFLTPVQFLGLRNDRTVYVNDLCLIVYNKIHFC